MKKQNLKRIVTLGLIAVSILAITPTKASATWKQEGMYWLYEDGQKNVIGWDKINGNWYYFDSDGRMKTGWIHDNGKWYFANRDGIMQTGTVNIGGMQRGNRTIGSIREYSFAITGEEQRPTGTVDIELSSMGTTGYFRNYDYDNIDKEGIIKRVSFESRPEVFFDPPCGGSGTDIWTFKGLKEGSTEVTFKICGRGKISKYGTTFLITVDKDLNISVLKLN